MVYMGSKRSPAIMANVEHPTRQRRASSCPPPADPTSNTARASGETRICAGEAEVCIRKYKPILRAPFASWCLPGSPLYSTLDVRCSTLDVRFSGRLGPAIIEGMDNPIRIHRNTAIGRVFRQALYRGQKSAAERISLRRFWFFGSVGLVHEGRHHRAV